MKYLVDEKDLKEIAILIDIHAAQRTVSEMLSDYTLGDMFVDYFKEYADKNKLNMTSVFASTLKKGFLDKLDEVISEIEK